MNADSVLSLSDDPQNTMSGDKRIERSLRFYNLRFVFILIPVIIVLILVLVATLL